MQITAFMSGDKPTILPLFAAAGAAVIAVVFSAAALALDEEEANSRADQIISVTSDIVKSTLTDGWSTCGVLHHGCQQEDQCPRKYIWWDRNRAKLCISKIILAPTLCLVLMNSKESSTDPTEITIEFATTYVRYDLFSIMAMAPL
jgi:hypothetical protein